jgi:hypothetical protein
MVPARTLHHVVNLVETPYFNAGLWPQPNGLPAGGVVSDESATGKGLASFNRPRVHKSFSE